MDGPLGEPGPAPGRDPRELAEPAGNPKGGASWDPGGPWGTAEAVREEEDKARGEAEEEDDEEEEEAEAPEVEGGATEEGSTMAAEEPEGAEEAKDEDEEDEAEGGRARRLPATTEACAAWAARKRLTRSACVCKGGGGASGGGRLTPARGLTSRLARTGGPVGRTSAARAELWRVTKEDRCAFQRSKKAEPTVGSILTDQRLVMATGRPGERRMWACLFWSHEDNSESAATAVIMALVKVVRRPTNSTACEG